MFYPDGRTETVAAEERPTATLGRAFLRAVATGDHSRLRQDYDDAARSLDVCLAANESAQTGRPITLHHRTNPEGQCAPPALGALVNNPL